jgi:secreted protein with Ig-like and vWFA domain
MKGKLIPGALLVLGLVLVACDGINDSTGGPNISVYGSSRSPKVGETLRAFSSGAEFTGDFIWEWSAKREGSSWCEITVSSYYYGYWGWGTVSEENDKKFTIGQGLVNYYLRVRRKTKDADNAQGVWVYSDILGRIQAAD